MIYGVGTGRCGTHSLAEWMKGLCEPYPKINPDAKSYYLSGERTDDLMNLLKVRAKLDTPLISDNKQSFVIDLIHEVDPTAEFIWLIREPVACIGSFMNRGNYADISGRMIPKKGFPGRWGVFERVCWLWVEKNLLIEETLKGLKYKVIFTDDLPMRTHIGGREPYIFSRRQKEYLKAKVLPLWERYKNAYSKNVLSTCAVSGV